MELLGGCGITCCAGGFDACLVEGVFDSLGLLMSASHFGFSFGCLGTAVDVWLTAGFRTTVGAFGVDAVTIVVGSGADGHFPGMVVF